LNWESGVYDMSSIITHHCIDGDITCTRFVCDFTINSLMDSILVTL